MLTRRKLITNGLPPLLAGAAVCANIEAEPEQETLESLTDWAHAKGLIVMFGKDVIVEWFVPTGAEFFWAHVIAPTLREALEKAKAEIEGRKE